MPLKPRLSPLDLARLLLAAERVEHARTRCEALERERVALAREIHRRYRIGPNDSISPETGEILRKEG